MKHNIKIFLLLLVFASLFIITNSFALEYSDVNCLGTPNGLNNDVHNVYLSYFGKKNNNGTEYTYGFKSKSIEEYQALISYVDKDGNLTKNKFFDTFVFLPYTEYRFDDSNINTTAYQRYTINGQGYLYTDSDVLKLIDDALIDVKKLDDAMGDYNLKMGVNYKANVIFAVVLPWEEMIENNQLKKRPVNERIEILKSFVNKWLTEYNSRSFSNLELIGFYWGNEEISWTSKINIEDIEIMQGFNEYVHSLNLKTLWIPYTRETEGKMIFNDRTEKPYKCGYGYGFDEVSIIPSYYADGDESKLELVNELANTFHYSVEIEYFEKDNKLNTDRHIDFLRYAINHNWMSDLKIYYAPMAFLELAENNRKGYNITYRYAAGILTLNDLESEYAEVIIHNNNSNNSGSASYCSEYKKIDGKYYDSDGNEISKLDYEKACPKSNPKTGYYIPISVGVVVIILAMVALIIIKRKNKLIKI